MKNEQCNNINISLGILQRGTIRERIIVDDYDEYTVVFSDGMRHIPQSISRIATDYGWMCVCMHAFCSSEDKPEVISFAIFPGKEAYYEKDGDIPQPRDAIAEIYITCNSDPSVNCAEYLVEYGGILIGERDDYACDVFKNKHGLDFVEFANGKGIQALRNCLNERLNHNI